MKYVDIEYQTKSKSSIRFSSIPGCCELVGGGQIMVMVVCSNPTECSIKEQCGFRG